MWGRVQYQLIIFLKNVYICMYVCMYPLYTYRYIHTYIYTYIYVYKGAWWAALYGVAKNWT